MCGFTHTCDSKSNNCSEFFREHLHLKKKLTYMEMSGKYKPSKNDAI